MPVVIVAMVLAGELSPKSTIYRHSNNFQNIILDIGTLLLAKCSTIEVHVAT